MDYYLILRGNNLLGRCILKDEEVKKEIELGNLRWSKGEDPAVYSDYIHAVVSERNFVLTFGQREFLLDSEGDVRHLASISMHPDTAQELLDLLERQIELYKSKRAKQKKKGDK